VRFAVVYDACVLYPAPLRDLLLQMATRHMFAARWTDQIHDEWIRSVLADRPDLDPVKLHRTRELMDRAVPDCLVSGHERLVESLELPDADDRHVLAAAIVAGAQMIVTFNLRDFPEGYLAEFGIEAVHPDRFIECQMDLFQPRVIDAVRAQRALLRNPPRTARELLDTLAALGLTVTADRLAEFETLI
jgi:hypothetical protein